MNRKCEEQVIVGLSGGVDSSVAAWRLVSQGYDVFAGTHRIVESTACFNEETLQRARDVSRQLNIPYRIIDHRSAFQDRVIDRFIGEYRAARTPNPCILCNERVRFSLFYDDMKALLEKEQLIDPEKPLLMATGHYARISWIDGRAYLRKGADPVKDQSYMLYRIRRNLLPLIRFPLGDMTKSEAVELAYRQNLPTKSIKESQDICFVDKDYISFLRERLGSSAIDIPGPIYDTEGREIGTHRGYLHYTIGQRQGLGLSDGPWYVSHIDADANRVTVARREDLGSRSFTVSQPLWDLPTPPPMFCRVQIRYNAKAHAAYVQGDPRDGALRVELEEPAAISPGQSAVFYDDELVIGGGIID